MHTSEPLEVLSFKVVLANIADYPSLRGLPEHIVVGLLEVRPTPSHLTHSQPHSSLAETACGGVSAAHPAR
jgi:hypothetical protein